MTTFYCFPNEFVYKTLGGRGGDYTIDGVGYSTVGADPEDEASGFLVNTTNKIDGWEEYECFPDTPMRIFG